MTDKKITLEEIKKLNAERTQGDWGFHYEDDESVISFFAGDNMKDIISSDYAINLVFVAPEDREFISNAPKIAEQYIWLVEKLQKLANKDDYIGRYLKDLLKYLGNND